MCTKEFFDLQHQGICAYNHGDYLLALEFFEVLQQKTPGERMCYYNIGITLEELERWDEANNALRKAISLSHKFADAFCHLGQIAAMQGQFENALEYFLQASVIEPKLIHAIFSQGTMHHILGNTKEAKNKYMESLQIDSEFLFSRHNLAILYTREEQWDLAIDELEKCLSLSPQNATLRGTYAYLFFKRFELDRALIESEKAFRLDHKNILHIFGLTRIIYEIKITSDPLLIHQHFSSPFPVFPAKDFLLGLYLIAIDKEKKGKQIHQKVLCNHPEIRDGISKIVELFPDMARGIKILSIGDSDD